MLVGNCCCFVLYWVAVSLYSWRANATLFSVEVSSSCSWPMLPVALSWGYCSTTTMRRWSADDRAFSAWLICLMPSGPVALTFTAWLRAWITASSVERSNSMAPLTAFTRLGIRSWRRLSWTSTCLKAWSVWFVSEMSPLYAPISQRRAPMSAASRIQENIAVPQSCGGWGMLGRLGKAVSVTETASI